MIKSSEIYKSNAEASETFLNDLDQKYIKGEISHGQYIEGMKEVYENILEALSALNDLDKDILKYYGETLAAASEELESYTSRLEMFTDVLDHYLNVVKLVKGEAAYADISKILNG
ncbi:MAG: hypothetical protein IKT40_04835 [Bacilli bacterium]|nr:hypothetical protein [Bacilli bacterium]